MMWCVKFVKLSVFFKILLLIYGEDLSHEQKINCAYYIQKKKLISFDTSYFH
jgi:hypothetical protein